VTEKDSRRHGCCGYCRAKWGEQHDADCVCRTRTIVVEHTYRHVRRVPDFWDEGLIEFVMNESSTCADNFINEMADEPEETCSCRGHRGRFIREATVVDEEQRFPESGDDLREAVRELLALHPNTQLADLDPDLLGRLRS
jgi:hypothetical protein